MTIGAATAKHLYDALNVAGVNAIVSGRIYAGAAPANATRPLVLYRRMGMPGTSVPQERQINMEDATYVVVGIVEGPGANWTLAEAIQSALHGTAAVVGGYTVRSSWVSSWDESWDDMGKRWSSAGGRYRILVAAPA